LKKKQIFLDDLQDEILTKKAEEAGTTVSELIRRSVDHFITLKGWDKK
jgi:hypothetical protein